MAHVPVIEVPVKFVFADGLVVGPGDTLVLRLPPSISDIEFYRARNNIAALFPETLRDRVVVVAAEAMAKVSE